MVLAELGLTYKTIYLDFSKSECRVIKEAQDEKTLTVAPEQHKSPEFLKLNPNGRIPALVDHANNDFTLW
jgi:glutathione S-transferase